MNYRKTHGALFAAFLTLLAFPLAMEWTGLIKTAQLEGAFTVPQWPVVSWGTVADGSLQGTAEERARLNMAFMPDFIRLSNTLNYRLFNELDGGVIVAPNGHLLQQGYVQAFEGTLAFDSLRFRQIGARMHKIHNQLREWEVPMLVVIAPNKADWAFTDKSGAADRIHEHISDEFERNGIPCINMHTYFKTLKDDRLFTKNGIHWSTFGASVAVDTLLKRARKEGWFSMELSQTDVEQSSSARYRDDDLERILNLWGGYQSETYFYPENHFTLESVPPNIVGIGDSFYWTLYDTEWIESCDSNSVFYYYNQRVVDRTMMDIDPANHNPRNALKAADLFLWVVTEPNSLRLPFDFDETLFP